MLTQERAERAVADAMLMAAESCGVEGKIFITEPTSTGAYVSNVVPPFSKGPVRYKGGV